MRGAARVLAAAVLALPGAALAADSDTIAPRGPSEWTGRNWLGLCIQLTLFFLALWGIWRLAEGPEEPPATPPPSGDGKTTPPVP